MEEDDIRIHPKKEDKVHLIQVPKGFDITKLNDVEYNPGQVLEIEVKQGSNDLVMLYELGAFDGQNMDLSLLVKSDSTIKAGPSLSHNLCVNKSVRLDLSANSCVKKDARLLDGGRVVFPKGLRQRFTPFGSGNAISSKGKGKSKSKRKRSHVSGEDTGSPTPRKKRHKHNIEDSSKDIVSPSEYQLNCSIDDVDGRAMAADKVKKHKKRKHRSGDSHGEKEEGFVSPIAADDKLFNGFLSGGDEVHAGGSKSVEHNLKSHMLGEGVLMDKSGDASMCSVLDNDCSMDDNDDVQTSKKKKRHSSHYTVSSTDNSLHVESSGLVVKEKRKKEKKKKRDKE